MPLFDFSSFQKDNFLYSDKNRKELLYFKDENPNEFIKEFIGLRSKLYAIKTVTKSENLKCKGYSKKFRDSLLSYKKYRDCHKNLTIFRSPLLAIRSFDYQLYNVFQNKVVLNNFDSKMFICDCNIHTFFYASNDINSVCSKCNR